MQRETRRDCATGGSDKSRALCIEQMGSRRYFQSAFCQFADSRTRSAAVIDRGAKMLSSGSENISENISELLPSPAALHIQLPEIRRLLKYEQEHSE